MAPASLQHVRSGDLITAQVMNQLIDELQSLHIRVSDLESGEGTDRRPVLINRSPEGDVEVGSLLTLNGRNFQRPSNLNTVTLGSVPITQFVANSDDQHLSFAIPSVFSDLPRTMPVSVSNQFGSSATQLQVRVLPHTETQGGQVAIFGQTQPLGQINIGAAYELSWLVDSQTVLPVVYNLSVVFTNLVGVSLGAWQAGTQITPIGAREIRRGSPLLVTASVTVPLGAVRAQVALKAESTDHVFTRTSDSLSLIVGQTAVVSDLRALLTLQLVIPPFDPITGLPNAVRNATINGISGVEVQFGASGQIPIRVHVTNDQSAAGTYVFSASVEDATGLWQTGKVVPAQSGLTAPSDPDISVSIQNTDTQNPPSTTAKFMIVRATHRTAAGADDFVSFVRFPIRGFTP